MAFDAGAFGDDDDPMFGDPEQTQRIAGARLAKQQPGAPPKDYADRDAAAKGVGTGVGGAIGSIWGPAGSMVGSKVGGEAGGVLSRATSGRGMGDLKEVPARLLIPGYDAGTDLGFVDKLADKKAPDGQADPALAKAGAQAGVDALGKAKRKPFGGYGEATPDAFGGQQSEMGDWDLPPNDIDWGMA